MAAKIEEQCEREIKSLLNSKSCGKCETQSVTAFCLQCLHFICKECHDLHMKWKDLRSHNIITIEVNAQFHDALLASQQDALSIFSKIKQNMAKINSAFECYESRKEEIDEKQTEVKTAINQTVDAVIQKVEERRTQLISCLKENTQSVMNKLADERNKVEEVHKMFNTSLHDAISSFSSSTVTEREQLMTKARDGVDNAEAMMKALPLQPTVRPYMNLVDIGSIHEACGSFGRISNYVALCAEMSTASGDGLKFARIGESIAVTVHPKDNVGEDYTKQVHVTAELTHCTTQTSDAICTIEMQSKSQYSITYKPLRFGKHTLRLCINGNHIQRSPFTVSVHATGELLTSPNKGEILTGLKKPTGIATNSSGDIFIVESDANCISVYSADYQKIVSFCGALSRLLNRPYAVAIDSNNNFYVTDSDNHCVQKFTSNGVVIARVGIQGSTENEFNNPRGIAYNSFDRRLYVCDYRNHRIVILNTDLTWHDSFPTEGDRNKQLRYPRSIAFDSCGQIYVTEYYSLTCLRIQIFSPGWEHQKTFDAQNDPIGKPYGIAVDSGDTMYVTDVSKNCISVFDSRHNQRFVCSCGTSGKSLGQFNCPYAIHIDAKDKLYVADTENGRVQIFQ